MSILIRNTITEENVDHFVVPTRPEGGFYRFEMIFNADTQRCYGDDLIDLLETLIPGYGAMDQEARLEARIAHAVDTQVSLQSAINLSMADIGRTPAEDAILNAPRHTPPLVDEWLCEIPLVLVDAQYAPYGDEHRPMSGISNVNLAPNLWWLNPAEGDMEYLRSLHEAWAITLNILKDEAI